MCIYFSFHIFTNHCHSKKLHLIRFTMQGIGYDKDKEKYSGNVQRMDTAVWCRIIWKLGSLTYSIRKSFCLISTWKFLWWLRFQTVYCMYK